MGGRWAPFQILQDGKVSKERKTLIRGMKKELGIQPFGELPLYSMSILPEEKAKMLNSRERESLDLQWARLQATRLILILVIWTWDDELSLASFK